MTRFSYLSIGALTLALVGCGSEMPNEGVLIPKPEDTVATTFYPTTWMTRYLLGNKVNVVCPLPDGEDPIFWTPDDKAISTYQSAKLIVTNGANFEKWLDKVTLPRARIVDTTAELEQPFIRYETAVTHQHGPSGEQSLEGIDGHTWLDPGIARKQAERIAEALSRTWPQHASLVEENLKLLTEKLNDFDARLRDIAYELKQKDVRVLCSHPAYNYLARRYGWKIENLDLDPSEPVSDDLIASLIEKTPRATIMLWESEPIAASVEKLTAAGVKSVVFSPCETKPAYPKNYWEVMTWNISRMKRSLDEK